MSIDPTSAKTQRKLPGDQHPSPRYKQEKKVPQSGKIISPFSKITDSADSARNKQAGESEVPRIRQETHRPEDQTADLKQFEVLAIAQPKYSEAAKHQLEARLEEINRKVRENRQRVSEMPLIYGSNWRA